MKNDNSKHGLYYTPIYSSWRNMLTRCYNSNDRSYPNYGGRGIRVCESLRSSVVNLKLLIGDPPECYTLNRIDNDANYSCGECAECLLHHWNLNIEWATRRDQQRNRRVNRILYFNGEHHCATEWSEILNIPIHTIEMRLYRGMTDEQALSKTRVRRTHVEAKMSKLSKRSR